MATRRRNISPTHVKCLSKYVLLTKQVNTITKRYECFVQKEPIFFIRSPLKKEKHDHESSPPSGYSLFLSFSAHSKKRYILWKYHLSKHNSLILLCETILQFVVRNSFAGKSSEYCRSIVDSVFHLCHSNTCVHSFFAGLPKDFCPPWYLSQKILKIHRNCSYSQGTKSSLPSATNSLWTGFLNWLSSGYYSWREVTKWSGLFCNKEEPNKNAGLMKRVLSLFRVSS